jgi:bacterial/archaeal transporter family-2 protein
MGILFVLLSLIAGGLLPVQAGANAQLSKTVANPFAATTLQLFVGALVLTVIAGIAGSLTALPGLAQVTWWHAIGGLASALYIVSGILLFPRLGAVVTIGLFIAGQMLASVVLDTFGILGVASQPFDVATALGTGAVLLGTVAIVTSQASSQNAQPTASLLGLISLAVIAGAVLARSRRGQRTVARRSRCAARRGCDQLRRRHARYGGRLLARGDRHECT